MMDIGLLIAGVLLGGLFGYLTPRITERYKRSLLEKRIRTRRELLSASKIYEWLHNYYLSRNSLNDLFDCRIGAFEIKIPFFSAREWQFSETINIDRDRVLEFVETESKSFPVDEKLLNKRRATGQRVFPENQPILYFDYLELRQNVFKVHVKKCGYHEMATNLAHLEDEMFEAIQKNRISNVPIRDNVLVNIRTATQAKLKPLPVGCSTVFAIRVGNSYKLLIHTRSRSTITLGGTKAVLPTFGLNPPPTMDQVGVLFINFLREYLEEMYDYEELINLSMQKKVDPLWFQELPEAQELLAMYQVGIFKLEFLGFGFNCVNGSGNFALLARIDDPMKGESIRKKLSANWEVATADEEDTPIELVDFRSAKLETWLREKKYHPGSAFALSLAISRLEEILATTDESREIGPQFTRQPDINLAVRTSEDKPSIKILFLSANPQTTPHLKLDEEIRNIDQALRQTEFRDRFDIAQHWAVRIIDIQGYLLRHKPDIVHFSGHGSEAGEIILENDTGNSHPVSVRALSNLFSLLKDRIRCVVLNACYSEQQAQAIAEHIDCVIGMSKSIGDTSAISFATAFYQALGYGRDIKTAFELGCTQIDFENIDEHLTPKLLAKKCNPYDIYFA